jgi:hypothetical protein
VPAVIRQLIRYTYPPAMCAKVYELMASGRLSVAMRKSPCVARSESPLVAS